MWKLNKSTVPSAWLYLLDIYLLAIYLLAIHLLALSPGDGLSLTGLPVARQAPAVHLHNFLIAGRLQLVSENLPPARHHGLQLGHNEETVCQSECGPPEIP